MPTAGSATHLTVLGGGAAGLAVGFYARRAGIPFDIYEASDRPGGNCVTLWRGDFAYDSGAHRLHDKDPEVTADLQELLGPDLLPVRAPSQIYHQGRFIDFPLSPLNLLASLGPRAICRAGWDFARARLGGPDGRGDFESFAVKTYGRSLADMVLLNYSEKLWGLPCSQLSPQVAGARLKGLNLLTFLTEIFRGRTRKTKHLDGAFYYPRQGFGQIGEALASACGAASVHTRAVVEGLAHDGQRITGLRVNGQLVPVSGEVVSSLPLTLLLRIMDPPPPPEVMQAAAGLIFRHMDLVVLMLDQPACSANASIYFPQRAFAFTRLYEPKNRSPLLAPPDKTCVVVEIPTSQGGPASAVEQEEQTRLVIEQLAEAGLIDQAKIIDQAHHRIGFAYPVLQLGSQERVEQIMAWLGGLHNLRLTGRCGRFQYAHLHDMLAWGREITQTAA